MRRWQPQDHYFKRAKKEGFPARSVYKLDEIDRRTRLLRPGHRVLDLGCYPGSWLEYCARAVGQRGLVVGVDIRPMSLKLPSHVHVLQMDVFELQPADLHRVCPAFDVVLSDLAPATTGIPAADSARSALLFERAMGLAGELLVPGGHFLGKIFQGSDFDALLLSMKPMFRRVRGIRPHATRKESKEVYLLGMEKRVEWALPGLPVEPSSVPEGGSAGPLARSGRCSSEAGNQRRRRRRSARRR
jgi:23S rRNA (uridine2552-2'-O)-methyltransferase